jgi:hypothetical protein
MARQPKLVTKTLKAECIEVSMSATKEDMSATITAQGKYPFDAKICVTLTANGTVIVHGAKEVFFRACKAGETTTQTVDENVDYTRIAFTQE